MKKFKIDFILTLIAFLCASFYYLIKKPTRYYNLDDLIIENNSVLNFEAIKFEEHSWPKNLSYILILTIILYLFFKINHHFIWKKNLSLTKKITLSIIFALSIALVFYTIAFILFVFIMKGTS